MSAQDRDFLGLEVSMIVTPFGEGDKRITGVVQSLYRDCPTSRPVLVAVETLRNFPNKPQVQAATDIDKGPYAFPFEVPAPANFYKFCPGMTLRDYFAAHCPITYEQAQDYNTSGEDGMAFYATMRGQYADAMIAERAK